MTDLFGNEIQEQKKHTAKSSSKKKVAIILEQSKIPVSTRGLLGCTDFGEFIRNRGNKTIV